MITPTIRTMHRELAVDLVIVRQTVAKITETHGLAVDLARCALEHIEECELHLKDE